MRLTLIAIVLLSLPAWCQSTAAPPPDIGDCARLHTPAACHVSKRDFKHARDIFRRGLSLRKKDQIDDAFDAVAEAARLVPDNLEYVTTREILRQQLVLEHLNAGNALIAERHATEARAEYRQALALDPSNEFSRQRLRDAVPPPSNAIPNMSYADRSTELRAEPTAGVHSFHFKGESKKLVQTVAAAFGITPEFDDSFQSRPVRFDVDDVNFWRAMQLVGDVTHSFWTPMAAHLMLVAADTAQNRAQFERMSERTFYFPDATSTQQLQEVFNVLRTLFDIRQIVQQSGSSSITVRAPRRMLDAATELLRSLDISRPQVFLDVQVLQVNTSMLKDMGIELPLQWQAFSLSAAALAVLQQPNAQQLIQQLISSGGLTSENSSSLAALLQQLQNQQSSLSSLINTPFATVGGGRTLFAIPFPSSTVHFSLNSSKVTTVQNATLRASQGDEAKMLVGQRYPIVTATFSPIYSTQAISQVLQQAGASPAAVTNENPLSNPYPSFTFEDLGLTIKAKPQVHENSVALELTLELKSLTGTSYNGVPVISDRSYTGQLSVRNGGTAVVAGEMDMTETRSISGLPGLGLIPIVNRVATHYNPQQSAGELLVLITPHIIRPKPENSPLITIPSD